jgi:RNA polymerase sigma factor (sigma-70 family)
MSKTIIASTIAVIAAGCGPEVDGDGHEPLGELVYEHPASAFYRLDRRVGTSHGRLISSPTKIAPPTNATLPPVDDFELLDRWKSGDTSAGNQLLKRHFDALYRFFTNKLPDQADDLIQATMMACVRGVHTFRKECGFRSFLFVVARHELYRFIKTNYRSREVFDPSLVSVADMGPSPSSALAKRKEQRLLLLALRRIPIELQIVLELHYWEGLSTSELADAMEIPQGTAKSRLRRAREALERELAAVAESQEDVRSTLDGLEHWVAGIRAGLGGQGEA